MRVRLDTLLATHGTMLVLQFRDSCPVDDDDDDYDDEDCDEGFDESGGLVSRRRDAGIWFRSTGADRPEEDVFSVLALPMLSSSFSKYIGDLNITLGGILALRGCDETVDEDDEEEFDEEAHSNTLLQVDHAEAARAILVHAVSAFCPLCCGGLHKNGKPVI